MAEGVANKSREELKREITCAICQEHYTEPKLLPCNHYFCKECILQLVRWAGAVKCFSCPKCRKEVVLPKGGVEKLGTAFLINSIQESIADLERPQSAAKGEVCVGPHADSEFMGMHAELACQIQRGVEEHDEGVVSLEPMEEVDVGVEVRCAEALQQLCQTKAKLTQFSIAPAKCTVSGEGAKAAVLNTISEVTLTTTKRNCKVDCHLKSLSNGSIIQCNVDHTAARNYCIIQYTPTVRGRCELTVSVDGQQVADSPFPVFVSVPVAQLGRPVSVWRGLSRPSSVAVNSVGEVVVGERKGDVIVFDKEGMRLKTVQRKLGYYFGVAVDGDDNIYCTDFYSNEIMRYNRNGGCVKEYHVKQVQRSGHLGVAVVGDEVMVCERGNEGTIMVYDRELKYLRQISGRAMGTFFDLSPDSHGNLYVTDLDNSVIRVFSVDGDLLRSFGCDENGVKKLSKPWCVCVAGQYVYVTDSGLHNVSVFTTVGVYVTSFGHCGSEEGCFFISICIVCR